MTTKGKERKGKEGKERRGNERKGEERNGKGRKDYTFRGQFDEKPSIILGCPGLSMTTQNGILAHLEGCVVARVQLYERVDFINGVSQLEVSVCRGHFQLCDQAVYFADEQADG